MRYLPLGLIALYAFLGYVPPSSLAGQTALEKVEAVKEGVAAAFDEHASPMLEAVLDRLRGNAGVIIESIERAVRERDIGVCKGIVLPEGTGDGPSRGDVLAYCLARVLDAPQRCAQISATIGLPLRELCEGHFAHSEE